MARGFSQTTLVGNVGNDPEVKYTQAGMAVARISLATTSVRKDRDGNPQEQTQWHRLVFFGKLAEIVEKYVKKGAQLFVQGELRYDKFTGQDGQDRYTTDIVCSEMQMLGSAGDSGSRQQGGGNRQQQGGGNGQQQDGGNRQQQAGGNRTGYGARQQAAEPPQSDADFSDDMQDFDSERPF